MDEKQAVTSEVLRVGLSRTWIAIKGLVCGTTMMLVSLPLAFYNVFLWIGIEILAVLCGLFVFLKQLRQRGIYTFYPDRITVEGRFDDSEETAVYTNLTPEKLRISQGPIEHLLNVGKIRLREENVSLYGVSDFARVRAYLKEHYQAKDGIEE